MKAVIKDGNLIITLPLKKGEPSKSGKTLTVATTNGFMVSDAETEGKKITISVNASIKKD